MVHLIRRIASAIVLLGILVLLFCCGNELSTRRAVAEANPISQATFHIEIVGQNALATFAYQTTVLHIDEKAKWEGIATVQAYNMVFQQECQSLYSSDIQAKRWRGKWAHTTTTTPKEQIQLWLELFCKGKGSFNENPVPASSLPIFDATDERSILIAKMNDVALDWNALCDAHIDSMFGSQSFLTNNKTGTVTLYFEESSLEIVAASFTAGESATSISGIIEVFAVDGQSLPAFPDKDTLTKGILAEEWRILDE